MFGSIIVLVNQRAFENGNFYCPWEDYEMRNFIMRCDYVGRDDPKAFKEAIGCFAETYDLPEIQIQSLDLEGEQAPVAILRSHHIEALKYALDRRMAQRILMVKAELKKPEPSLWHIAHKAYNFSPVYFACPEEGFFNEVSFHLTLPVLVDGSGNGNARFYITETHEFHV